VPALTDEEAWEQPASRETIADTLAMVVSLVEPSADADRVQVLTRYLTAQDYTEAEIKYVADQLPKDEHLDNKMRYGKPLTPADFERVIKRCRKLRARWKKEMDRDTMLELIEMEPSLTRDDFGERLDRDNNRVYLLKKQARQRLEATHA